MLAKGPVGVVLPVAVAVLYLLWSRSWQLLFSRVWIGMAWLFALVAAAVVHPGRTGNQESIPCRVFADSQPRAGIERHGRPFGTGLVLPRGAGHRPGAVVGVPWLGSMVRGEVRRERGRRISAGASFPRRSSHHRRLSFAVVLDRDLPSGILRRSDQIAKLHLASISALCLAHWPFSGPLAARNPRIAGLDSADQPGHFGGGGTDHNCGIADCQRRDAGCLPSWAKLAWVGKMVAGGPCADRRRGGGGLVPSPAVADGIRCCVIDRGGGLVCPVGGLRHGGARSLPRPGHWSSKPGRSDATARFASAATN